MSPTLTARLPHDPSLLGRLRARRETDAGRLAEYGLEVGAVAALYYGAARAGLQLAYLHGSVTALWPPVGVGMALLAIRGPRLWPGIVAGDLLVGDFSTPVGTVLGQTLGNTLEVVAAAVLFRRLAARRIALERVRDVLALVGCAALGTLVSAVFGVVSLRLGDVIEPSQFGSVFRTWWLSDFSGALVVAPLFLAWAGHAPWRVARARFVEGALMLAALVVLVEVPSQQDVPYIVFPVLIWAALRFGAAGAATAVAMVSFLAVWNTAHGSGPFVRASITHSLLASQLFVAIAALTSLVLAAVTAERSASEAAQRELTAEQAALRRIATLMAGELASENVFEQVAVEAARAVGAPAASLARFDDDGVVAFVGGWSESGTLAFPVGSRLALADTQILAAVRDSGQPRRIERYEPGAGRVLERFASVGYGSAIAAPVKLGGHVWGALVAAGLRDEPFPDGAERRLTDFTELLAQALANADAYAKLAASRARIVEAADAERRRLERNLHDGAQQRLVSLALQLRIVRANVRKDPEATETLLAAADAELRQALEELRELARGIHPTILTDQGLAAALELLAGRAPVPVTFERLPDERLPAAIEAAIYYLVAEAMTNVAKYAQATRAWVAVERSNGVATIVVGDDGGGGADPGRGSGLIGLADRVEALGGQLHVESPHGGGTRLTAEIPCG